MKKLLLPLFILLMLLCACTNRADTGDKQSLPPASADSPSTEAMPEVTAPKTDSEADNLISTDSQGETEASSQETAEQTDETTASTTAPTTVSTTESTTVPATEPATNPTTVTTTNSTTATTTAPKTEPTTAKESTAPSETVPPQTEFDLGVDTEGAIVYESGNDIVVSWDDSVMVINGAAKRIDEQFTDYFIYDRIYYINVSNDPTWNKYEYIAGEELMEITNISGNRNISQLSDGTSSKLAVGTKIYRCENQWEMLLALVDGELVPYYAMVEG